MEIKDKVKEFMSTAWIHTTKELIETDKFPEGMCWFIRLQNPVIIGELTCVGNIIVFGESEGDMKLIKTGRVVVKNKHTEEDIRKEIEDHLNK
jgi:hypothetical protein